MEETSIKAYYEIKRSGLLAQMIFEIYEAIVLYAEPCTCREIVALMGTNYVKNISPRFAELERLGLVRCIGKRTCKVTSKLSKEWEVIDTLPKEPVAESPKTKVERQIAKVDKLWEVFEREQKKLRAMLYGKCKSCKSIDLLYFDSALNKCASCGDIYPRGAFQAPEKLCERNAA